MGLITVGLIAVLWGLTRLAPARAAAPQAATPTPQFVWPISGSGVMNLPQSSAYGPRQKASDKYRYDYHQGIDFPTDVNTPLLAVTTGTVRIAGSSPSYSDGIVQITTTSGLYINYIHITASLVTTGQVVSMGDPVALSGIGESGFPHLHFEIRRSASKADAINAYRYLPYTDTVRHTVVITQVVPDHSVWISATTPANELDLNLFTVTVTSQLTGQVLDSRTLDFEARNKAYDGEPTFIDIADHDGILISPARYTTNSTIYGLGVWFHDLLGEGPVLIEACVIDVKDNRQCTTQTGSFTSRLYLPLVNR